MRRDERSGAENSVGWMSQHLAMCAVRTAGGQRTRSVCSRTRPPPALTARDVFIRARIAPISKQHLLRARNFRRKNPLVFYSPLQKYRFSVLSLFICAPSITTNLSASPVGRLVLKVKC
uniref:Uncharacterized protein n=1 Tax=Plectus sambesii TaxID=2011161 RepID=A0A914XR87_9BILA